MILEDISSDLSYITSLPDLEGIVNLGSWNQIPIIRNGREIIPNMFSTLLPTYLPTLEAILKEILQSYAIDLPLGAMEISTLSGNSQLKPHCGPTNHKIRFHLGIKIPTSLELFQNNSRNHCIFDSHSTLETCSDDSTRVEDIMIEEWIAAGTDPYIRVGNERHYWEQGKVIVFDDSFEHEVLNQSGQDRTVLIVDIWHPLLSLEDRNTVRKHFSFK